MVKMDETGQPGQQRPIPGFPTVKNGEDFRRNRKMCGRVVGQKTTLLRQWDLAVGAPVREITPLYRKMNMAENPIGKIAGAPRKPRTPLRPLSHRARALPRGL